MMKSPLQALSLSLLQLAVLTRPTVAFTRELPLRRLSSATNVSNKQTLLFLTPSIEGVDGKSTWQVFWDLECPFARKNWEQYPALRDAFESKFDMSVHLTSLTFHPRAWIAQCAAFLIRRECGEEAWLRFINACYEEQHLYKDDLIDPRQSEIVAVFADIASRANIFSDTFTREYFLEHSMDWNEIVKPTYQEAKYALTNGVFGTPKHVINGKLVTDTESSWGVEEWQVKLRAMGLEY